MQSNHPILCHPFSSCPQSFPTSGSFPMSSLFASGGQSIGVSASVIPMNNQGWFPLGLTDLLSLLYKGLSRVFSSIIWNHQVFHAQPSFAPTLTFIQDYWKNHSFDYSWPLSAKWCLCFLIHCLDLYSFSSKEQASFYFMAAVTVHGDFEAQENKICP